MTIEMVLEVIINTLLLHQALHKIQIAFFVLHTKFVGAVTGAKSFAVAIAGIRAQHFIENVHYRHILVDFAVTVAA